MTALLIDVGNTRTKLALLRDGRLTSAVNAELDQLSTEYLASLVSHEPVTGAYISNVAGERAKAHLTRILRDVAEKHEFLVASRTSCGITNAYEVPEKLGSDRWAALIGAHALRQGALCIVSVGTAMTVDALDADGTHLGGLIVPGPRLMVESLFNGTSDIAQRALHGRRTENLLATDTLGAVLQGAELCLASLIQRVHSGVQAQLGQSVQVIVTGGAAHRITHLLQAGYIEVPDLVLRGLSTVAQHSKTS